MMKTRISAKGQVVIPLKAREQLHWKEGMDLSVEVKANALLLRGKKPSSWRDWQGALRGTTVLKDLEREHEDEII